MSKASFAAQLRQVREKVGLSQYGLAKRTGLTRQAVSQLEMGQSEPTWTTVQLLAAALAVDYAAFSDPALKLPDAAPVKPRGRPRKQPLEVFLPSDGEDAGPDKAKAAKAKRRKG